MTTATILNQVLTLFIIMIVGIAAKKMGVINEQVNKKLSEMLLHITSPALIFSSFLFDLSAEKLSNAAYVFGFSLLMFVFSIVFSEILFIKMDDKIKPIMIASAVFSNCGYMGFPLLQGVFGKEGVFYGSIYIVAFNIFFWTYGAIIFSGQKNLNTIKNAFLSPSMIAIYLGTLVFLFQIPVPSPLENAIGMVGSMTMPLAMIIIGAIIAQANVKIAISGFHVYYSSFIRLIFMPVAGLALSKILDLPEISKNVSIILLAMPVAVNVAVFAEKFDRNSLLASKCVTVSTILSIITIPAILLLL